MDIGITEVCDERIFMLTYSLYRFRDEKHKTNKFPRAFSSISCQNLTAIKSQKMDYI